MNDVFHEGELAMQARSGEALEGGRNGKIVSRAVMPGAVPFLQAQRLACVATFDESGAPWASLLFGPPGFMGSDLAGHRLTVRRALSAGPIWEQATKGADAGVLAIDLGTRRRLRVNGTVAVNDGESLQLSVREAYPNCPKYIQRRELHEVEKSDAELPSNEGSSLTPGCVELLERADTAFVASRHPERGADASHRGGEPGFLRALDSHTVRMPDYAGNSMFNTLGNLLVSSHAGLSVVDFERGRLLLLTGEATVRFGMRDDPRQPTGGTGRYWDLDVTRWYERPLPARFAWRLLDRSKFNPHEER